MAHPRSVRLRDVPPWVVLCAALSGVPASRDALAKEGDAPKGAPISVATADKAKAGGTFWESAAKGPAVVLLPDEGAKASSLEAVVAAMIERRLAPAVVEPRAGAAAAEDAAAVVRWLRASVKGRKVGILAVGSRAGAALHAAKALSEDVTALLVLEPKGAPADAADAKGLPASLPIAVVARDADKDPALALEAAIDAPRKAAGGAAGSVLVRLFQPPADDSPAGDAPAGAGPFGAAVLLDAYVAGWFARTLAVAPNEPLLDGDVTAEGAEGGAWTKAAAVATDGAGGKAWAYRYDRRVIFGGFMPKGITMLRLRLKAAVPGFDWRQITESPIAPGKTPHQFLELVVEAPSGKVRLKAGPMGGGTPEAPTRPGGMPPMHAPGRGESTTPWRVAFAPHDGGWSFEGDVVVTNVEKERVKNPRIELGWGWLEGMPPMPKISMRPWMDFDVSGTWTEVPAR